MALSTLLFCVGGGLVVGLLMDLAVTLLVSRDVPAIVGLPLVLVSGCLLLVGVAIAAQGT